MGDWTLADISKTVRDIDFGMLVTKTDGGGMASRPMSNNGDVEYDGNSFFFSNSETRTVSDIERDPTVTLTYTGSKSLLGAPPPFISIAGKAELIRDKAQFEAHWNKDLEYWFEDGIDTPGIVLIKVLAERIHYWDGEDQGEVRP